MTTLLSKSLQPFRVLTTKHPSPITGKPGIRKWASVALHLQLLLELPSGELSSVWLLQSLPWPNAAHTQWASLPILSPTEGNPLRCTESCFVHRQLCLTGGDAQGSLCLPLGLASQLVHNVPGMVSYSSGTLLSYSPGESSHAQRAWLILSSNSTKLLSLMKNRRSI